MKQYKAYNIEWDTDGKNINLPSEVIFEADNDEDISLNGANILSDKYGWCINSFSYDEL